MAATILYVRPTGGLNLHLSVLITDAQGMPKYGLL